MSDDDSLGRYLTLGEEMAEGTGVSGNRAGGLTMGGMVRAEH
ncbi:hypothetical protein V5E97_30200 [Singulisphaera sp. Ch08]|uniref:Uncharacterized protein n=1 Tax=Singulisphaera sp. Ch08 TaxID=3120278 RepID=A0AAU7CCY0_9BACT